MSLHFSPQHLSKTSMGKRKLITIHTLNRIYRRLMNKYWDDEPPSMLIQLPELHRINRRPTTSHGQFLITWKFLIFIWIRNDVISSWETTSRWLSLDYPKASHLTTRGDIQKTSHDWSSGWSLKSPDDQPSDIRRLVVFLVGSLTFLLSLKSIIDILNELLARF